MHSSSRQPFVLSALRSQPLQFGDGLGCDCDALDGTLVASPANSEVAVLAPGGAPTVLHNPVLLPGHVAAAIPHQEHSVVGLLEGIIVVCQACVVVDALLVVHEVRVDLLKEREHLPYFSLLCVKFKLHTRRRKGC